MTDTIATYPSLRDRVVLITGDIARPALFFASGEAGAVTNQSCVIDGGWL